MLQTSAANQPKHPIVSFRTRTASAGAFLNRRPGPLTDGARLHLSAACLIMARGLDGYMATPNNLFRLLSEFILLLLGALLILLAATGRIGLPSRPGGVVALGAIFIFWGVRAATRPGSKAVRLETVIRAGSLLLVGILILAVPFVPAHRAPQLFILAGGVLVLRGALAAAISVAHR
jgi:hypothetical protein